MSETVATVFGRISSGYDICLKFAAASFSDAASFKAWKTKKPEQYALWAQTVNLLGDQVVGLAQVIRSDGPSGALADQLVQAGLKNGSFPHKNIYSYDPGRYYLMAALRESYGALAYFLTYYTLDGYDSWTAFQAQYYKVIAEESGLTSGSFGVSGMSGCGCGCGCGNGLSGLGLPIVVIVGIAIIAALTVVGSIATWKYFEGEKFKQDSVKLEKNGQMLTETLQANNNRGKKVADVATQAVDCVKAGKCTPEQAKQMIDSVTAWGATSTGQNTIALDKYLASAPAYYSDILSKEAGKEGIFDSLSKLVTYVPIAAVVVGGLWFGSKLLKR